MGGSQLAPDQFEVLFGEGEGLFPPFLFYKLARANSERHSVLSEQGAWYSSNNQQDKEREAKTADETAVAMGCSARSVAREADVERTSSLSTRRRRSLRPGKFTMVLPIPTGLET